MIQLSTRTKDFLIDPFDMFEDITWLNQITTHPDIVKVRVRFCVGLFFNRFHLKYQFADRSKIAVCLDVDQVSNIVQAVVL